MSVKLTNKATGQTVQSAGDTVTSASGKVTLTNKNTVQPVVSKAAATTIKPTATDRVVNVIAGSAKQAASGTAAAAGTALEGMSKISNAIDAKRSAQELEELKQQNQRYAKMYYDGKDANGKALSSAQKDQLWKDMQRNATRIQSMSQTTQARQDQRTANAVQAYDRAAELGASSHRNIEAAKEGLNGVGRFAVDVGVGGTQLLGDMAANIITPGAGLAMMGARSFGSGAQEARQDGATFGQQVLYGAGTAGVELLTEKFSNIAAPFKKAFGKGIADEAIKKAVGQFANTTLGKLALSFGSEALEEMASDALSPALKLIYQYGDEKGGIAAMQKTYGENFDWSQVFYDGLVGGALGLVGGVGEAVSSRIGASETQNTQQNTTQQSAQPTATQNATPNAAQARTAKQAASIAPAQQNAAQGLENTGGASNQNGMLAYSEQEKINLSSGSKNKLISTFSDAVSFVKNALTNKASVDRAYFGKIPESTVNLVRDTTGVDISGYSAIMNGHNVRHIIKEHGSALTEDVRNQRAVSPNDIAMIPEILSSPDKVTLLQSTDQEGRKALQFSKQIGDNYITIQGVADGKKALQTDTMFIVKKKGPASAVHDGTDINAPMKNVQGVLPQDPSFDSTIAQEQNPVNISDDLSQNNDEIGGANTVGSAQSAFDVKFAQNQTRSTDPVFTDAERQIDGLRGEDRTHQVQSHNQTESLAKERLAFDYDFEKADLANRTDWDAVDESMSQQILRDLVKTARETSDYSEVVSWTKLMDERIGEVGRTLNMAGAYADRPETIIGHAAETLDEANLSDEQKAEVMRTISEQAYKIDSVDPTDTASLADLVKENSTIRKTNSLFGNKLSNRMAALIDGDSAEHLRLIALAQVKNMASDQIRPTFSDSVRSFRIQSMLSNLGTITRNLVGNHVFDPVETIANDVSLPLDMLMSQFTGTRSVAGSKSWGSKAKRQGSVDAATKSAIEVALDVDTSNAESRYGVSSNRTFHMSGSAFERFMSTWAKWQGYALNTTDEWQKGGIRADVQSGIDALKAQGKITDNSLDNAGDEAALYTTFQDDNGIGRAMQYAQQAGNALSEGILGRKLPVGFGDWLLPFARVPGNLVARGIDYNPAGAVLHTGIDIVDAVLAAKKGKLTAAQQRNIALDVGRGATGALLIGLFAGAASKGIIKVPQDDADKDKAALEGAEGISGTQVNLSALKRFAQGESTDWQENDYLVSIGFLQPINYLMTTGALLALDMEENGGFSLAGLGKASAIGMMQSLLDMPVMSSLKALVDGYNYSTADSEGGKVIDAILAGVSDLPASFVPNIVRAGARGLDNNYRVTSRGNKADAVVNGIKATIPGLRETLPEKIDPLGRDKTYTDNTLLNVLNASLLPGAITKYKQSEVGKELERVYQATKRTDFYPNSTWIKKKVSIDGKERVLTDAERDKVQRSAGQEYERQVKSIMKGWAYKNATEAEQADMLARVRTYAYEKAKTTVLGAEKSALVRKFSEAEKAKVNFADYSYFEANKDADGSGSVTQAEAAQTLIKIMSMTDEQRGVLWKTQNKEWKDEKNPFTGTIAQSGVSPDIVVQIMSRYTAINGEEGEKGKDKKKEFDAYLRSLPITPQQTKTVQDVYKFWINMPVK